MFVTCRKVFEVFDESEKIIWNTQISKLFDMLFANWLSIQWFMYSVVCYVVATVIVCMSIVCI